MHRRSARSPRPAPGRSLVFGIASAAQQERLAGALPRPAQRVAGDANRARVDGPGVDLPGLPVSAAGPEVAAVRLLDEPGAVAVCREDVGGDGAVGIGGIDRVRDDVRRVGLLTRLEVPDLDAVGAGILLRPLLP